MVGIRALVDVVLLADVCNCLRSCVSERSVCAIVDVVSVVVIVVVLALAVTSVVVGVVVFAPAVAALLSVLLLALLLLLSLLFLMTLPLLLCPDPDFCLMSCHSTYRTPICAREAQVSRAQTCRVSCD